MRTKPICLVLLALPLSGCLSTDPLFRKDLWNPTGVVEQNLQAMMANPADARGGHGTPGSNGQQAYIAAHRYDTDQIKPLPSLSADGFNPGGGGSSSSSSGGGAPSMTGGGGL